MTYRHMCSAPLLRCAAPSSRTRVITTTLLYTNAKLPPPRTSCRPPSMRSRTLPWNRSALATPRPEYRQYTTRTIRASGGAVLVCLGQGEYLSACREQSRTTDRMFCDVACSAPRLHFPAPSPGIRVSKNTLRYATATLPLRRRPVCHADIRSPSRHSRTLLRNDYARRALASSHTRHRRYTGRVLRAGGAVFLGV